MLSPFLSSIIGVTLVSITSLLGVGLIFLQKERLAFVTWLLLGVSTGALFGDVFLHLLPELVENGPWSVGISIAALLGILCFFIVEKFIHWHHCHNTDHEHPQTFATMSVVGDALHNFIDGMIIAGSFLISPAVGVATTIAVFLHELPQEISDVGVLLHGGYAKTKVFLVNWGTSIISILGVCAVFILPNTETISPYLSAFAIGSFLYIAGSDLIPMLHKETSPKRSVYQFIALISGILLMALLLFIE